MPLDAGETERLLSCVKTPDAKAKITEMVALVAATEKAFGGTGLTRVPTPYELHLDFVVPLLSVVENGKLFDFESTYLIEHAWQLSAKDASLPENYNPLIRPVSKAGMLDVSQTGKIETSVVQDGSGNDYVTRLHQAVLEFGPTEWTTEILVGWLDRHINHQDIPVVNRRFLFIMLVRGIMTKFGIADVRLLALDRYRLRDEIETKIQQHRWLKGKMLFSGIFFLIPL